jgi:hypothetical protein
LFQWSVFSVITVFVFGFWESDKIRELGAGSWGITTVVVNEDISEIDGVEDDTRSWGLRVSDT